MQDSAKGVDGVGAYAFVSFQPGDLRGADVILLDEGILGESFFFHGFPKLVIRNHSTTPFSLDIITDYGV